MRPALVALFLALPCFAVAEEYRIAFVSHRGQDRGIYVMNGDGSGLTRLTDDTMTMMTAGALSKQGQIAFNAVRTQRLRLGVHGMEWGEGGDDELLRKHQIPFHFPLYVMSLDGSRQKRVIDVPVMPGARWSPDGSRLAVSSAHDTRSQPQNVKPAIYVINVETRQMKRVADDGWFPAWSSDGTRLFFTCGMPAREVCAVDSDGAHLEKLTTNAAAMVAVPSPAGSRIAFIATSRKADDTPAGIYVMDANGAHQRRISKLRASTVVWSPDGKRILIPSGNQTAYLVDVDGNFATKLSLCSARALDHTFAPDGARLIYRCNEEGRDNIYDMDLATQTRRRLSDGKGEDSMFAVSP